MMGRIGERGKEIWRGVGVATSRFSRFFLSRTAFVVACLVLAAASFSQIARPLDDALSAWRAQALERPPTGSIVVVEIDSSSLRAAGEWPWPRVHFAQAIGNLRAAGAEVIAFDVDFSARSTSEQDVALQAALSDYAGAVILPTFVQGDSGQVNSPLASLSADAVFASVNVPIDGDGRVRRYYRGVQHGRNYHVSMASVLAAAPYGATGQFLIDYGIRASSIDRLSFADVLSGNFDPERVRGKVVLIGATALELGDEFATPLQPSIPGVYVHALAYESLVQGRALVRLSDSLVLALALSVLFLLWPRRAPLDLKAVLVRHGAILSALILTPIMIQALAPIHVDAGLLFLAQALCIVTSLRRELAYRAAELVRAREAHLTHIALHDPETNLPNRRAMLAQLREGLAESGGNAVVAIAIGIDRFATLRGAIGYANANRLVAGFASQIEAKAALVVHHLSTSILGVVLIAESEAEASAHSVECMESLETAIQIDGQTVELAIRIGVAVSNDMSDTAERLLENAAIALDHARIRNQRCVVFNAIDLGDPKLQLALTSDIGAGIARGEFALVYQAKADAHGGGIVGAEALLRWTHPRYGKIAPDRFVPTAEETGAIIDLTRWAVSRAIADQALLRARGIHVALSVNISARALADEAFCSDAVSSIAGAGAQICFEITETAIIDDPPAAVAAIARFRDAGIGVSIDDYGSGLSSLAYLKQLAADELKLDKELISELKTSARDRLILKSTIDLAHGLGMSVVAEGVEDETTCAMLAAMGCDQVQGYLVAHPLPVEEFWRLCVSINRGGEQAAARAPRSVEA